MKTKFLRVFALFASVLVLVTCLIVPMSADSFDSSKSLVETDWNYVTTITAIDFDRFNQGVLDFNFDSVQPCYVIFDINGDRYSIRAESIKSISSGVLELVAYSGADFVGVPRIIYDFVNHEILGEVASDVYSFRRVYSEVREFRLTIYHNVLFSDLQFDSNYYALETYDVEPTITRITSVFTNIMGWITSGLNSVQGVFYANNQLTMLGTLAVIGVAVGVAFLIIGVVQKFLKLRS